jgi:hypothetical protein
VKHRTSLVLLLIVALLLSAALSARLLPLVAVPALLYARLAEPTWATSRFLVALFFASLALTLSPLGITLRDAPGPPRLVGCCCCAPYVGKGSREAAIQDQAAGRCYMCSDLVRGFEPHWYLIW